MAIGMTILSVILIGVGVLAFASAREMGGGFLLRVPGIGPLTPVSGRVVGLACMVIAYHLLAEAWGFTSYRAPWAWVLGGSAVAVVLALGTDRLERDAEESSDG